MPRPEGLAAAPAAVATGQSAVGDSFVGPFVEHRLVAIAVPVVRQDVVSGVLISPMEVTDFARELDAFGLPDDWVLTLADSRGETIARRAPIDFDAVRDLEGSQSWRVDSGRSPWTVTLDIPRASYNAPLASFSIWLAVTVALAAIAGLLGGSLASRRLRAEVVALTAPADS